MRGALIATVALAAGALTACGQGAPLGGGLAVGLCDASLELDALPEPRPAVRADAVRYADGALRIYDRIDLRLDKRVAGAAVERDLRTVRTAMAAYRRAAHAAAGGPDLARAFLALADGPYDGASDALAETARKRCPR